MANIDDAFRVESLSLGDNILITEGTINPSVVGYEANIGSLYFDSADNLLFRKVGNNDTDWKDLTNHGNLSELLDDDHPQYALAGTGSVRTFEFGDLSNINDLTHTIADDGIMYGLVWNNTSVKYDIQGINLTNLGDVSVIEGPSINGYGLTWDNSLSKWVATALQPILHLYNENFSSETPPAATGINSIALGSGAQTTADNSLAIGDQSLARIPNSIAMSGGRFGSSGDAQSGKYFLRTTTINGSATEAFIDGTNGSIRLTLPDNSTWSFSAMVTAHQTSGTGGRAGYKIEGVIYRDSGANTISFQGNPIKSVLAESDPAWDINILADTTNGSLSLNVTGETGKTIRWLGVIDTVELTN